MSSSPPTQHVFAPGLTLYSDIQTLADGVNWANGNPRAGQPSRPYFNLWQSVAQSVASNTDTPILFDSEGADNENGHSTTVNTSRYTFQTAGVWLIFGAVVYASSTAGTYRQAKLRYNGSGNSWLSAPGPGLAAVTFGLVFPAAGDYFEVIGRHDTGSALNTGTNDGGSRFGGFMLTA